MIFGKEYDYSLIRTSSKEAMLRSALLVTGNDIKKAAEICDYFTKQLPSMPERDPEPMTMIDQLDGLTERLSAWGEKHPEITSGIGNALMSILRNSQLGSFLAPAADIVKPAPIV